MIAIKFLMGMDKGVKGRECNIHVWGAKMSNRLAIKILNALFVCVIFLFLVFHN